MEGLNLLLKGLAPSCIERVSWPWPSFVEGGGEAVAVSSRVMSVLTSSSQSVEPTPSQDSKG